MHSYDATHMMPQSCMDSGSVQVPVWVADPNDTSGMTMMQTGAFETKSASEIISAVSTAYNTIDNEVNYKVRFITYSGEFDVCPMNS